MEIPCKSIEIPGDINGIGSDSHRGLLAFLGYSGAADGPGVGLRRKILQDVFCAELVPLTDQNRSYILEFGPPGSKKRFDKILNYLQGRIRDVERYNSQAWLDVLRRYEEDHDWFVLTIGPKVGVQGI